MITAQKKAQEALENCNTQQSVIMSHYHKDCKKKIMVKFLKDKLKERGLAITGCRNELIAQLHNAITKESEDQDESSQV